MLIKEKIRLEDDVYYIYVDLWYKVEVVCLKCV